MPPRKKHAAAAPQRSPAESIATLLQNSEPVEAVAPSIPSSSHSSEHSSTLSFRSEATAESATLLQNTEAVAADEPASSALPPVPENVQVEQGHEASVSFCDDLDDAIEDAALVAEDEADEIRADAGEV